MTESEMPPGQMLGDHLFHGRKKHLMRCFGDAVFFFLN